MVRSPRAIGPRFTSVRTVPDSHASRAQPMRVRLLALCPSLDHLLLLDAACRAAAPLRALHRDVLVARHGLVFVAALSLARRHRRPLLDAVDALSQPLAPPSSPSNARPASPPSPPAPSPSGLTHPSDTPSLCCSLSASCACTSATTSMLHISSSCASSDAMSHTCAQPPLFVSCRARLAGETSRGT
jgi:hypothetical protein